MPLAAIRNLFSRMSVKFGAAMVSSAALGLLLGHALFSRQTDRIPLDEWQPFVGQKYITPVVDAEPLLNEAETMAAPDVPPAATAPREQAYSAVRQFSELLHIPAAKVSANEDEPQRASKDVTPSRPPKNIRRDPRLVSAAPDRRPDTTTSQGTAPTGTEAAKDQDGGLMQRSYRAIASAPSQLWSTTQEAAKSVGSLGEAAWDRIKP